VIGDDNLKTIALLARRMHGRKRLRPRGKAGAAKLPVVHLFADDESIDRIIVQV
jgi:hypothetical protein